ncbi:MAG: NAD(P)-dependent oxidoreductase [Verrucomicrobia bacterium]|nr:NAD(P)-dependent oxidoreductase [Verrucomicrobiota bacterium]
MSESANAGGQVSFSRIVVLGSGGFIGTHLCERLKLIAPDTEIVGRALPALDLTVGEQADRLASLFTPNTAVISLAAIKRQLGDTLDSFTANLKISTNLARLLARHPVARFIYLSSAAVYGEETTDTRITEETAPRAASYYGMAKLASELLLRKAAEQNGQTSLLCVRPPLIYGPGDQGGYGPTGFIQSALRGEPIVLWGDGTELREFIYVADAVRALGELLFQDCTGVLNLASGRSHNYLDALAAVERCVPLRQPMTQRPRSKGKADHGFDNARLRALLPSSEFTSLAEGIRLTVEAQRRATT